VARGGAPENIVIPPGTRRCPECGHRDMSYRFAVVETERRRVACPSCGTQFVRLDDPWLV
jgi:transposase